MAAHFHSLIIKEISHNTGDSVIITFELPDQLVELFRYTPGQNLTIKANINGEELRRTYSICSAPFENKLSIAVRKAEPGKFSAHANEYLKKGDVLEVLPPAGRFFTRLHPGNKRNYLAFAAGSGITPIISIIKATLATEPSAAFTLIYGNRTRSSIMFFEELEGLKNKYMQRFSLVHILSREQTDTSVNTGRIDPQKLADLSRLVNYNKFHDIFICGPQAMVFCIKNFLIQQGIGEEKIHFELFTTPGRHVRGPGSKEAAGTDLSKSSITIRLDGRSFSFELGSAAESILDAALKTGADLPFACKGGVCSTCRAKLIEGKVSMDANYALEPAEVVAGYILTCQSHPLSKKLVIDFDLR